MKKILIFAGTTEGRTLCEYLTGKPVQVTACVATEYGRKLLPEAYNLSVNAGRMDSDAMTGLMESGHFDLVLDATHPYAQKATENIRRACDVSKTPYQRVLRDLNSSYPYTYSDGTQTSDPGMPAVLFAGDIPRAVSLLDETCGPVFLATGSSSLNEFMSLTHAAERLFVRILPDAGILSQCIALGISPSHIFCMQGPFDTDINIAVMRQIRRRWESEHLNRSDAGPYPLILVTKQSGHTGGFDQKMEAARALGASVIVTGRPEEDEGISLEEAFKILDEFTADDSSPAAVPAPASFEDAPSGHTKNEMPRKRLVTLIGMGMSAGQITPEADAAIRASDIIIGSRRMIGMASGYHKPCLCSYDYPAIAEYMTEHTEYNDFAVLFSGDTGFYSGAESLRKCLDDTYPGLFNVRRISGISSPVHFLNTIGKSWQDVHMISCHGQSASVISQVSTHEKTLILLGSRSDAARICSDLIRYGLADVTVWIGSDLKTDNEKILTGKPSGFTGLDISALSLIYIENPGAVSRPVTYGLPDDSFTRGNVPMTKSEVRSIVLSKLALTPRAVLYDIGAGTGSVSVEAARQIPDGCVIAVERDPEAVHLIRQNSFRHHTDNITVIGGTAPECFKHPKDTGASLPVPTHAFIGGSGGNLSEIIRWLYDVNPSVRVVLTAVTIETLMQITDICEKFSLPDPEIVQVQVSKAKKTGSVHMMQGRNPVYIITIPGSAG